MEKTTIKEEREAILYYLRLSPRDSLKRDAANLIEELIAHIDSLYDQFDFQSDGSAFYE